MLGGINVLNKTQISSMPDMWWIGMVIIMIIAALIGIFVAIMEEEVMLFPTLIILGLFVSLIYVAIVPYEPTGRYTYQVTIDETVNFKDFNDMYKVTKQEGEIYYIEEKASE